MGGEVAIARHLSRVKVKSERPSPRPPPGLPGERDSSRFARIVADSFERGVLRYSRRVKLLKLGERMGLDRFEAHLVIAAVQYRAQREEHVHASMGMAPVMSTRRVGYISSILLFVLFQSVILWVGWSLLRS